jgi:hypothetical protein
VEPIFAFTDRVVLKLKNGSVLDSGEIRFARGNAKLPLHETELRAKFMDCSRRAPRVDAEALLACLMNLEGLDRVGQLMDMTCRP